MPGRAIFGGWLRERRAGRADGTIHYQAVSGMEAEYNKLESCDRPTFWVGQHEPGGDRAQRDGMAWYSMKAYWNDLFGLDTRSLHLDRAKRSVQRQSHRGQPYAARCGYAEPYREKRNCPVSRAGKTRNSKTGDLLLHIWLIKGDDLSGSLWLSETSARNGANKRLYLGEKKITMVIPPHSHHGLTIRLNGFGKELDITWGCLFIDRKRGDALIKLFVYEDRITPNYGSFQTFPPKTWFWKAGYTAKSTK